MSNASQNAQDFLELCSNDQSLRLQLKALNDEQIISLASSKGYSFTVQDIESILNPDNADRELDAKDLELVAGGARALNAVSDGLVCNTIRSLFSTESGCGSIIGGGIKSNKKSMNREK